MDRPRIGKPDETDVLLDVIEEAIELVKQDLEVLGEALSLYHRPPGNYSRIELIDRIQTAVRSLRHDL